MKIKNKIMSLMLSLFVILSMAGANLETQIDAAEGTVNVSLHKRHNMTSKDDVLNTGEIMEDFGGEPLEDVEFTAYDVTDEFHELMKGSDEITAISEIQALFTPVAPDTATVVSQDTTDSEGIARFENLDIRESGVDGRYKVYVFVETKTPSSISVMEKSTPIVLAMPIYKLAEDGTQSDVINNDIHVYPKNTTVEDEKIFDNADEFTSVDINGEKHFNIPTGAVLDFSINLNIPTDISEKVEYSLTDTPSAGLAYILDTLTVSGLVKDVDYSIDETAPEGGFKVTFNLESEDFKNLAGKVLVVKYQMELTADVLPDDLLENKAHVSVDNNPREDMKTKVTTDPDNPEEPEIPIISTSGHKFIKTDSQTGNALEGAEFVVGNGKDEFAIFSTNSRGEYVFQSWTTKDLATRIVSNDKGEFFVIGLTKGDYILNETKAPSDKYVVIKGDIDFTVTDGYATSDLQVIANTPKGLLPSTGGNGIYAYLMVGAAMMLGSLVWFRRLEKATIA